jgi:hypothetical protein
MFLFIYNTNYPLGVIFVSKENTMTNKTIFFTLTLAGLLLVSIVNGQGRNKMPRLELKRMDSLEVASLIRGSKEKVKEEKRMSEARSYAKQTKATAKHARMLQEEANDAGREARYARRSESRAQKARKQADFQTDIASKAGDKSDQNMRDVDLARTSLVN